MKNFRAAAIGLSLFVVFAIGVTTLVYGTLRRDTTGSTKNYTAIFTDVTGVRVGDDVRIAGVRVGRVDSIELDGSLAKLKFRVKSNQNLYGNTIVAVTYQNIIGQRYISLSRGIDGSPERLPEGSVIPVERTEPSFDVGALLNGFEPLFTLLDPKQVDNLSNGLIDAFAGDRGALAHVVAQTTEITKSFAGRDQSLGQLIDNLNTVLDNVAKQNDNLDQLVIQGQNVVGELDDRRQSLVSSIGSATHVVSRIQTIGDNVYPQMQELVYREPGTAAHILANKDQFAFLGANLPLLLKGLARTTQDGAYGNSYACQLNINGFFPGLNDLVPEIVRRATHGNVAKYTPKCRGIE